MFQWFSSEGGAPLWLLLGVSGLTLFVFFERFLTLHTAQAKDLFFLDGIKNLLRNGSRTEALAQCDDIPAPFQALVRAGILNMDHGHARLEAALTDAGIRQIRRFERHLKLFAMLGSLLPMLGFFGTVLELLESVQEISLALDGVIRPLSEGAYKSALVQAMLTTAVGMGFGILAYAGYHLLVAKAGHIVFDMEEAASELLSFLEPLAELQEDRRPAALTPSAFTEDASIVS